MPGEAELPNRDVVAELLRRLDRPWSLVRTVEDRPGHDRRYAMDGTKLRALGWHNQVGFEEGIARTVDWFRDNEAWWRAIRSGDWDAVLRAAVRGRGWRRRRGGTSADESPAPGSRSTAGTRLMRVAVTGAGGRLGSGGDRGAERGAVHGPGRRHRLDDAAISTSTRPTTRPA